ncbi:uncharacterized protein [Aegilops tauschii subsp. strangulata]|uniref:uncharacterized protein isoform X2 n=1 Tax=Aegilops tauschii subsp. strangulata TaxID=200361 RepID=UPI001ABCA221|nr:uncharacterized protein LOC120969840 isoform X2 [Aegilops tauschii subsp. strangulata]
MARVSGDGSGACVHVVLLSSGRNSQRTDLLLVGTRSHGASSSSSSGISFMILISELPLTENIIRVRDQKRDGGGV